MVLSVSAPYKGKRTLTRPREQGPGRMSRRITHSCVNRRRASPAHQGHCRGRLEKHTKESPLSAKGCEFLPPPSESQSNQVAQAPGPMAPSTPLEGGTRWAAARACGRGSPAPRTPRTEKTNPRRGQPPSRAGAGFLGLRSFLPPLSPWVAAVGTAQSEDRI